MKAEDKRLLQIINGSKQFVVPVFQRDYRWTEQEWAQLWNDVVQTGRAGEARGHFLGSIVYVGEEADAAFNTYEVIDGQQRLASLILLLTALRDRVHSTNWSGGKDSPTAEKIDDHYLRNRHEPAARTHKLRLRRRDDETLQRIIDGRPEPESTSPVADAYRWFLDRTENIDPDVVWRGLGRLQIVNVSLKRPDDDPQLIFESLNSTGVALTQSDLVRNYLLMRLPRDEQAKLYEDWWARLEDDFRQGNASLDRFLREYVALKSDASRQPKDADAYGAFKRFWDPSSATSLEDLLRDLCRYSEYYLAVVAPSTLDRNWGRPLATALRNARAGLTVHALLGMQLFECHREGSLPEADLVCAFELIESYVLRRSVLGWSSRSYWDIFASIARQVRARQAIPAASSFAAATTTRRTTSSQRSRASCSPAAACRNGGTLDVLRVAFARQGRRFPDDDEFSRALQDIDLYRRRNCHQILARLENHGEREPSPVSEYSIEHVMPQALGSEWKRMLGADWETVHETWLHRLGNLTLTAYNSEMSNRPFDEKNDAKGGFRQSAARLNRYIRDLGRWTENEMKVRGEALAKRALRVWPHHGADARILRESRIEELRERARARCWTTLAVGDGERRVIETLLHRLDGLGGVIRTVEGDSICLYEPPEFFAEIRAMSGWVRLLLPLEREDLEEEPAGLRISEISAGRRFHGGVHHRTCRIRIKLYDEQDAEAVSPIIRRSFESAVG